MSASTIVYLIGSDELLLPVTYHLLIFLMMAAA